jgi:hypothetical protein
MKEDDWKKLCRNIHERNCVLVLGSQFPIERKGVKDCTTFGALLADQVKKELVTIERLPADILTQLNSNDMFRLTSEYLNYKEVDRSLAREDLECLLTDYCSHILPALRSTAFRKLSSLPFSCIVNTNYTDFFVQQIREIGKTPTGEYFNFRSKKATRVAASPSGFQCTDLTPFVYNLFGHIKDPHSLVISNTDITEFAINVVSGNPGLPANLGCYLAEPNKMFLFLGFGILSKSWFFRILLQALKNNGKSRMSYALECEDNFGQDFNPLIHLFRNELKISIELSDQITFIDTLIDHYNSYYNSSPQILKDEYLPKAFISYKSEDFEKVKDICQRLKQNGINVWLDKERLQGKWQTKITDEILNADAFVLMQSKQLKNSPVNYVNVEIKEALQRAKYYVSEPDFIFPAFIDSNLSVNADYPLIAAINAYDLTDVIMIDQLAHDIKSSFERNRRPKAA